jgi:glutamyl-tRNA reductase
VVLNRFFQKAFHAAKDIHTRAEIGRGAVSIKSAAVELVGRIFEDDLAGRAIMSSARARWQNPGFDRWSKEAPARF